MPIINGAGLQTEAGLPKGAGLFDVAGLTLLLEAAEHVEASPSTAANLQAISAAALSFAVPFAALAPATDTPLPTPLTSPETTAKNRTPAPELQYWKHLNQHDVLYAKIALATTKHSTLQAKQSKTGCLKRILAGRKIEHSAMPETSAKEKNEANMVLLARGIIKTRVSDKELTKMGKKLRKLRFEVRELEGKVCGRERDLAWVT